MKKLSLLIALVGITTMAFSQKFKPIFNGKNLDGWTIHGTEKMVCTGRRACL